MTPIKCIYIIFFPEKAKVLTLLASHFGFVSNPSRTTIVNVIMNNFANWVPVNLGFGTIRKN